MFQTWDLVPYEEVAVEDSDPDYEPARPWTKYLRPKAMLPIAEASDTTSPPPHKDPRSNPSTAKSLRFVIFEMSIPVKR